jgi:hypothetical protein
MEMTLEIVVGAAMGTLLRACFVQMGLWTWHVRMSKRRLAAWTAVLIASTAMALICFATAARALLHQPFGWSQGLTGCYVFVATLLLLRLMRRLILSWRMLRATPPAATDCAGDKTLCAKLRTSKLRTSTWISAPIIIGSQPLLPAECVNWDARKRRAVLAHTTAHTARGEFYFQLASRIHCALFWFSPLSWWLHGRLTEQAELASDDAAIEALGDGSAYAAILRDMARLPSCPFLGVEMARPTTIGPRIARALAQAHSNSKSTYDQQKENYYENDDRHPVACDIGHRPVVRFRARVSLQNEWQMLPVV